MPGPAPKSLAEVAHERLMSLGKLKGEVPIPATDQFEEGKLSTALNLAWRQQIRKLEFWADETDRLLSSYDTTAASRFGVSLNLAGWTNPLAEFMRRHMHYHQVLVAIQETPESAAKYPVVKKPVEPAPKPPPAMPEKLGLAAGMERLTFWGKLKLLGIAAALLSAGAAVGAWGATVKADREAYSLNNDLRECKRELARLAQPQIGPAPPVPAK